MAANIENIYSEFNLDGKSADFPIVFYEKHSIALNNIQSFTEKKELKLYIEIICKYAEAVYHKDRFNSAIDIIDKEQLFIDKEIQRLNAEDLKDDWYYSLQFVKGMASYNLKDYKTSTPIFKKLVQFDNQNERFKGWLEYSKYGSNIWLVRTINIMAVGLLLIYIFCHSQIPNFYVRQTIALIALLGWLATTAYEIYIKRSHRKVNAN
jgi:hypothetical protein